MGFKLTHLQYFILFLVVYTLTTTTTAFARVNVTISYLDPSITYSPPGAWSQSVPSKLDLGGGHMLTQVPNATASFNFTGIAIYFLAPLWPYLVTTAVSLDSGPISLINLTDHASSTPSTGQGPQSNETVPYQVVWQATGLADTHHNLRISVGAGQSYAIVDGLIYTTVTNATSSTTSSLSPTSTSPVIASSNASATSSPNSTSKSILAIALGSLFGFLGLLMILSGGWYLLRRRKRPNSEAWTLGGASNASSSMSRNPSVSVVGPNTPDKDGKWSTDQVYNNGYNMNQSNDGKTWYNPRYDYVGMPAPPIPSHLRGYQNDINSRTATHQGRASNRYEPGCALSTITERSTPQMGEGRTPLANSPASYQSDLEYHTAQGSEASYSVSRLQQEQQQPSRYPSQRRKPVEYN